MTTLRLPALILTMAFVLVGCQEPEQEFEGFTSEEGGFRAQFPSSPDRRAQNVGGAADPRQLIGFTSAGEEGHVYSVAFIDYPQDMSTEPSELLDAAAEGAASSVGGSITSRAPKTFYGYAALEYMIDGDDEQVRARAALVESRLYIIQLVRQGDDVEADLFEDFAGTFQLLSIPSPESSPTATATPAESPEGPPQTPPQ